MNNHQKSIFHQGSRCCLYEYWICIQD